MGKELEKTSKRIVLYEAKKDADWLAEFSFPPGFKITKVIGEKSKRIIRGNAADILLD